MSDFDADPDSDSDHDPDSGSDPTSATDYVRRVFPSVEEIADDELRDGVLEAWTVAIEGTGTDDLEAVPWFPPEQRRLDLPDETLTDHVRDVVSCALALASVLEDRGSTVSRDLVVAGALLHDVSKLFEYDGFRETEIGDLLGHPYYGVHVIETVDLPVELAHVVLSHTPRTAVEPAIVEAEVVRRADEVAAAAIRAEALSDLRDAE